MFYKSLEGISFLYVEAIREAVKEKIDFTELNMNFIMGKNDIAVYWKHLAPLKAGRAWWGSVIKCLTYSKT